MSHLPPKADVYLCITGTRIYVFKSRVQSGMRRDKGLDLRIRLGKIELKVVTIHVPLVKIRNDDGAPYESEDAMKPLRPEGSLKPWQELWQAALFHSDTAIRGTGEAVAVGLCSGTRVKLHSRKDVMGRLTHSPPSSSPYSDMDPTSHLEAPVGPAKPLLGQHGVSHIGAFQRHSALEEAPEARVQFNEPLGRALQRVPAKTACIHLLLAANWWLTGKTTGENSAVRQSHSGACRENTKSSISALQTQAGTLLQILQSGSVSLQHHSAWSSNQRLQQLTYQAGLNIPNWILSISN